MKKTKQLGIWMDHSNAIMTEISNGTVEHRNITSEFNSEEKEISLRKNENLMHNKEQHLQSSYYKRIADIIKNFNEVIIFGPTDAKNELLNLLKTDHLFDAIKIELKATDKLSATQMHDFVMEHFK